MVETCTCPLCGKEAVPCEIRHFDFLHCHCNGFNCGTSITTARARKMLPLDAAKREQYRQLAFDRRITHQGAPRIKTNDAGNLDVEIAD